ncbi:MAG: nucleotidyl transferase AbiEii/AbiGii toxin family protein [Smithella sp.]
MEFKIVLEKLLGEFERHSIRYALTGGFAMGLWGVGRVTVDIDFLVHRDDADKVEAIMHQIGYECQYRSENVAQYLSPLKIFGEIDYIFAFRPPSRKMLETAETKAVFNGDLSIRVLRPEDLIAMKMQAIKNDPARREIDLADIRALAEINKKEMDFILMGQYVKLLDMEELWNEILKDLHK